MIKCNNCGNEIQSDNVKFCPECGSDLSKQNKRYCMNCGTLIETGKFCPQCGKPVDTEVFKEEPNKDSFDFGVLNTIATNQLYDKEGFVVENGVLLKYTGSRRSVTIPGMVEEIFDKVFENNNIVSILTIEEGVKVIGKRAFANCSSLMKVYLPSSCDLVYDDVFEDTRIKELVLGRYNTDFIKCALSPLAQSYFDSSSDAKNFVVESFNGTLVKINEIEQEALRLENERLEAIRRREAEILAERRRVEEEQRRIAEEKKRAEEEKRRKELEAYNEAVRAAEQKKKMEQYYFNKRHEIGKIVKFGNYYYDSEESKKTLEWYIIWTDFKEQSVTLITKDIIDYQDYCGKFESNSPKETWYYSYLCEWLNVNFYNTAFNETEKSNIIPVVDSKKEYRSVGKDKVTLLDKNQFYYAFFSSCKTATRATPYAVSKIPTSKKQLELETIRQYTYNTQQEYVDENNVMPWYLLDFMFFSPKCGELRKFQPYFGDVDKTGRIKKLVSVKSGVRPIIKVKAEYLE